MKTKPIYHKQSGVVLLMFMIIMILGSSYLLIKNLNAASRRTANYEQSMYVLEQAKQALISYAVTYYDLQIQNAGYFGILPCPDANPSIGEEGNQDPNCGSRHVNSLGMLPWQSLGLPPLKDAYGQCLWYAVSGAYKNNPKPYMLNEDTNGTFQIIAADGSTILASASPSDRPVAVIIAPGRPVKYQNRSITVSGSICGGDYSASNFLDAEYPDNPDAGIKNYNISNMADEIDQFIMTDDPERDDFNDLIVYVTADEIWEAVRNRNDLASKLYDENAANNLTRSVALCLKSYAESHNTTTNYSMPWPAPLALSDYRVNAIYDDVNGAANLLSGRLPDIIDDSNTAIGSSTPTRTNLITGCNLFDAGTPEGAELRRLWENWKDHLFYAVADAYQPGLGPTNVCGLGVRCITINEPFPSATSRDYAAVVIFSNSPIDDTQSRNAPPIDADQKGTLSNYLDGANNTENYIDSVGDNSKRYDYTGGVDAINDILYCINDHDGVGNDLEVTICPTTP